MNDNFAILTAYFLQNMVLRISINYFVPMKINVSNYIKSFNWKMLLILGVFCVVLAVLNNIFIDDTKSVEWIGSQPVLEVPE